MENSCPGENKTIDQNTTAVIPRTVRDETFDLLRAFGITTIFGNVGSTEETFLQNFPSDFRYVLGLQEASVVGMADGYAQAMRRPALVNIHTGAGLGNAMGTILTAYQNKTPLIITAGQQRREMLLMEPWLTNVEPNADAEAMGEVGLRTRPRGGCACGIHAGDCHGLATAGRSGFSFTSAR